MRARYPDRTGTVQRAGETLHYEVYEHAGPTVLLAPTWQIVHSRHWKMQIPYLARHLRVVTFDPVGNGLSSRSTDSERYGAREVLDDTIAVLDATSTPTCTAVGLSRGGGWVLSLAALHPERVDAVVAIAAAHEWGLAHMSPTTSKDPRWRMFDPDFWRTDWRSFRGVLLRRGLFGPTIDEAVGRHRGLEPGDDRARDRADHRPEAIGTRGARARGAGHRGPGPADRRHRRPHRVRREPPRPAGDDSPRGDAHDRRSRAPAHRAPARDREPGRPRLRRSGPWDRADQHRRARRSRTSSARALHLLAHRARPCAPGPGDRTRGTRPSPRRRRRLARPGPRDQGPGGKWRVDPPCVPAARQRVGAPRGGERGARPGGFPGDPPDGRDPARELHGPRRRWSTMGSTTW